MKVHFSFSKLKKQAFFSKNAVEKCFLLENKKTTFFAKNVVEKRGPRPPCPLPMLIAEVIFGLASDVFNFKL